MGTILNVFGMEISALLRKTNENASKMWFNESRGSNLLPANSKKRLSKRDACALNKFCGGELKDSSWQHVRKTNDDDPLKLIQQCGDTTQTCKKDPLLPPSAARFTNKMYFTIIHCDCSVADFKVYHSFSI